MSKKRRYAIKFWCSVKLGLPAATIKTNEIVQYMLWELRCQNSYNIIVSYSAET